MLILLSDMLLNSQFIFIYQKSCRIFIYFHLGKSISTLGSFLYIIMQYWVGSLDFVS